MTPKARIGVFYEGKLALTTLLYSTAKCRAWELAKHKGWDVSKIELKPVTNVDQNR